MIAGRERVRRLVGDEQAADREAVRERLRQSQQVGADSDVLPREEPSRAPDAGLHLVEREQRAEVVRDLRCDDDEVRLERDHTALAEDGLEQDQADVFACRRA